MLYCSNRRVTDAQVNASFCFSFAVWLWNVALLLCFFENKVSTSPGFLFTVRQMPCAPQCLALSLVPRRALPGWCCHHLSRPFPEGNTTTLKLTVIQNHVSARTVPGTLPILLYFNPPYYLTSGRKVGDEAGQLSKTMMSSSGWAFRSLWWSLGQPLRSLVKAEWLLSKMQFVLSL